MAHPQLDLSNDELLSTTRAVRKRIDFDREVPVEVLKQRLQLRCDGLTAFQFSLESLQQVLQFGGVHVCSIHALLNTLCDGRMPLPSHGHRGLARG